MIEVENTDVNIVRNLILMRNRMPASAYGLKAISDWFHFGFLCNQIVSFSIPQGMVSFSDEEAARCTCCITVKWNVYVRLNS